MLPCTWGSPECFFKVPNLPSQPTKLPMDLMATLNPDTLNSPRSTHGSVASGRIIFNSVWCLLQRENYSHQLNEFENQRCAGGLLWASRCSLTVSIRVVRKNLRWPTLSPCLAGTRTLLTYFILMTIIWGRHIHYSPLQRGKLGFYKI